MSEKNTSMVLKGPSSAVKYVPRGSGAKLNEHLTGLLEDGVRLGAMAAAAELAARLSPAINSVLAVREQLPEGVPKPTTPIRSVSSGPVEVDTDLFNADRLPGLVAAAIDATFVLNVEGSSQPQSISGTALSDLGSEIFTSATATLHALIAAESSLARERETVSAAYEKDRDALDARRLELDGEVSELKKRLVGEVAAAIKKTDTVRRRLEAQLAASAAAVAALDGATSSIKDVSDLLNNPLTGSEIPLPAGNYPDVVSPVEFLASLPSAAPLPSSESVRSDAVVSAVMAIEVTSIDMPLDVSQMLAPVEIPQKPKPPRAPLRPSTALTSEVASLEGKRDALKAEVENLERTLLEGRTSDAALGLALGEKRSALSAVTAKIDEANESLTQMSGLASAAELRRSAAQAEADEQEGRKTAAVEAANSADARKSAALTAASEAEARLEAANQRLGALDKRERALSEAEADLQRRIQEFEARVAAVRTPAPSELAAPPVAPARVEARAEAARAPEPAKSAVAPAAVKAPSGPVITTEPSTCEMVFDVASASRSDWVRLAIPGRADLSLEVKSKDFDPAGVLTALGYTYAKTNGSSFDPTARTERVGKTQNSLVVGESHTFETGGYTKRTVKVTYLGTSESNKPRFKVEVTGDQLVSDPSVKAAPAPVVDMTPVTALATAVDGFFTSARLAKILSNSSSGGRTEIPAALITELQKPTNGGSPVDGLFGKLRAFGQVATSHGDIDAAQVATRMTGLEGSKSDPAAFATAFRTVFVAFGEAIFVNSEALTETDLDKIKSV
ncbi:hypothetical protein HY990_02440 [Candidatus Micrarchaeota archaeon]|nr:hypothetical protein [Candidatus Micrarchaeota archaeon]